MKRKFPWTVFIVLMIFNLLNVLLYVAETIDLTEELIGTIASSVLGALLYHIIFGGLIYLVLPAIIYFMLSKEDNKKNRRGYITAIVTVILQIFFAGPTYILVALCCIEGGNLWISFIYYSVAALLTIVAIIYSKIYLKLKVSNREES